MKHLVGTDGNRFYSWELNPGQYSLGRKEECDFAVFNNTVSRKHVQIDVTDDSRCFVTDLSSHNGTTLNNESVFEKVEVFVGDRINFGSTDFKISDTGDNIKQSTTRATTKLADHDPEKSVFLSINEVLQPLPQKVTELPNVLPTIFEMAKTLILPEPKEDMLRRSLGLIAKIIPAERLAILMNDDDSDEVYTAASMNPGNKDMGSLTLSKTIINDILQNKNAILIGNPLDDPHFAQQQSIIMSNLKSAMAVPLFDEGTVLGILYVDTTNPMHRYNDDYLKLLATFGNIIASRMVNYTLLNIRAERQLIEAELKRASSIQKKLLDIPIPKLESFKFHAVQEQCRAVGGDLYDFCKLPDGRLVLMVADVSGKGMGAALLMSNILASFRILYSNDNFDLQNAVKQVSTQLFAYSAQEDFATLFIALIDEKNNSLKYVNAGHNPPVHILKNGNFEYLKPSGIMIGAFPGMDWEVHELNLESNEFIAIYSDGVTEAEGEQEQYGEPRMEKRLSECLGKNPEEIASYLMNDINEFVGTCTQSDDVTLVILKKE